METFKCAFSGTLIGRQFACQYAEQVTRRGGPDIACQNHVARLGCQILYECPKTAALPAFGVEDDLLTMPHSVMQKIQFGGLLGLQTALHPDLANKNDVQNIHAVVAEAIDHFGDIDNIPCAAFVDTITSHKLKRRTARQAVTEKPR